MRCPGFNVTNFGNRKIPVFAKKTSARDVWEFRKTIKFLKKMKKTEISKILIFKICNFLIGFWHFWLHSRIPRAFLRRLDRFSAKNMPWGQTLEPDVFFRKHRKDRARASLGLLLGRFRRSLCCAWAAPNRSWVHFGHSWARLS